MNIITKPALITEPSHPTADDWYVEMAGYASGFCFVAASHCETADHRALNVTFGNGDRSARCDNCLSLIAITQD